MAKKNPKDETTTEPQTGNAPCDDCPRTLPQPDYDKARMEAYKDAIGRIEARTNGPVITKRNIDFWNGEIQRIREILRDLETKIVQIDNLDPKVLARRRESRRTYIAYIDPSGWTLTDN